MNHILRLGLWVALLPWLAACQADRMAPTESVESPYFSARPAPTPPGLLGVSSISYDPGLGGGGLIVRLGVNRGLLLPAVQRGNAPFAVGIHLGLSNDAGQARLLERQVALRDLFTVPGLLQVPSLLEALMLVPWDATDDQGEPWMTNSATVRYRAALISIPNLIELGGEVSGVMVIEVSAPEFVIIPPR